jgi:hypothetical protein
MENSVQTGVIISDMSDHFMVFIELGWGLGKKISKKQNVSSRNFSKHNINKFKRFMQDQDWAEVLRHTDINDSYDAFWNIFKANYELCFPITTQRFNKNIHKIHPHITKGLLTSRNTKLTLHKIALKNPTLENMGRYKVFRNTYNRLIKLSKKMYFEKSFEKAQKNPKKTWALMREALNTHKGETKIEKITTPHGTITTSKEMAETFNDFFVKAGVNVARAVPPTKKTPEDFLPPPTQHELHLGTISQAEVVNTMRALESKSSLDVDGVSIKLLKEVALEIGTPLTHIFNISVKEGVFPNQLKTSRVVPIFKAGDPTLCDNYRPIALLSSLSKTLEKIVANRLTNHLVNHKLLFEGQFGFQRNRNTEQNLVRIVNYISSKMNNGEYCLGVFLDLKKAFDVCSHEILLKKLNNLGIRGVAARWFENYLSDRKHQNHPQRHSLSPSYKVAY